MSAPVPATFAGWKAEHLYLTDNGACYCGEHLGASAMATGRDISGQPILHVTTAMLRAERIVGAFRCEQPRCLRTVRS